MNYWIAKVQVLMHLPLVLSAFHFGRADGATDCGAEGPVTMEAEAENHHHRRVPAEVQFRAKAAADIHHQHPIHMEGEGGGNHRRHHHHQAHMEVDIPDLTKTT